MTAARLIEELRSAGWTVADIARAVGVSERTIFRRAKGGDLSGNSMLRLYQLYMKDTGQIAGSE